MDDEFEDLDLDELGGADIDDINFKEFDEMFDSTEEDIAIHMKNYDKD